MSNSVTGSKWVGLLHLDQYNANLVIQDFKQEYGIDNEETFVLVKKITTVRTWLGVIDLQLFATGLYGRWMSKLKTHFFMVILWKQFTFVPLLGKPVQRNVSFEEISLWSQTSPTSLVLQSMQ